MSTLATAKARFIRGPFVVLAALAMIGLGGCKGCEDGPLGRHDALLKVEPDPIVFDLIAAREVATIEVRLLNEGSANLLLEGDPILEEYGDYEHPTLSLRKVLQPVDCVTGEPRERDDHQMLRGGECAIVEVVYSPRVVGETEGMLIFKSNDSNDQDGRREVPITARADAPDIELCSAVSDCADVEVCYDPETGEPLRIEFPLTQIGESRACGVRVGNSGNMALSSLAWGFTEGNRYQDFTLEPSDLSDLSLEPGEGVELNVVFTPVAGGYRTGTISLSSNDPLKPQVLIDVVGLGDGPKVCPDPMPVVDFGEVEVGGMHEKMVAFENCGTMQLEINDAWVQDATGRQNSQDYFLGPGASPSATLAPGEELLVPIQFIPRYEGQVNGRLYFESNDPIVPQAFVNLTGVGIVPPSCEVTPSTMNLSFGTAAVGYAPASRGLAVTNTGELPCEDLEGHITAGFAAEFRHVAPSINDQPFYLDPGDTVIFNLEYAPNDFPMNHTGAFTLETPSMTSDVIVQLSGTSSEQPVCNLSVTPRSSGIAIDECMTGFMNARMLQFGSIRTGQSDTRIVSLENVGSADCEIESIQMKDAMALFPAEGFTVTSPANQVLVNGVATSTIQPGETGIVRVQFAPSSEELSCADLWVQSNDTDHMNECQQMFGFPPSMGQDGCYSVQLRGTGVRARVAAVPQEVDFGLITIDCLSPDREVSLYNIGGAEVEVSNIELSPTDGTFRIGGLPPLPVSLPPGQKLTLSMTYAPTGNPTTHTGTLTFTSDAENSPTVVPLEGRSTHDTYQVDEFEQLTEPMVDVLWVIDDSCSMGDVQTNLRDNIHVFMQRALDQNTDFHMGVITTDWDDPNKAGRLQQSGGWPRIIDRNVSDPVQAFRDNANVGTSGHHIEKGFDSAYMALTEPLLSGHNAGFLRDDAKLAVIFVSDEDEQSEASVDFFVDFFRNIKGHRNDSLMSLHAIVGDHPGGCDNAYGSAWAAPRYIEAADRTGGLFRSICAPDWGQVADDMGLDAFAARREFFLSREPIDSSIQVQVDGSNVPRTGNWSYDAATNSVIFGSSSVPPQGATIRVSYDVLCRTP